MKTLHRTLFLAVIFCLQFNIISAQDKAEEDAPTVYHSISYLKVEPGNHSDYLKLEKVWKKIHQANIDRGKYEKWALVRVVSPAGTSAEYNYVTRHRIRGEQQLAAYMEGDFMPENWQSLLSSEEVALVKKTNKLRTMVKSEIWSNMEAVLSDDAKNAKVTVFNYFDFPEGKGRRDHAQVERDIWMPIHKARVDAGKMAGWVLLKKEFPFGADMPYHDATVDIYADMNAMLAPFVENYFEKIHSGKDIADLMKQTREAARLVRGEVRMEIDSTEPDAIVEANK